MRMVNIEPGGVFGPVHGHIDRPGTVYILQGTITDHRNGVATDLSPSYSIGRLAVGIEPNVGPNDLACRAVQCAPFDRALLKFLSL